MKFRNNHSILLIYALMIISFAAFFPSLTNGILNWKDDELFVQLGKQGIEIFSLFTLLDLLPLSALFMHIQYSIGGEGYFIYHAVNLLLHTANAILLFYVCYRLLGTNIKAFVISVLFLVHPIQTGTVAWVSQQNVLLSFFVLLVTASLYMHYRRSQQVKYYWLSLFSAGLFFTASTPALLPVLFVLVIEKVYQKQQWDIKKIVPFFVLWILAFLLEGSGQGLFSYIFSLFNESVTMLRFGLVHLTAKVLLPLSSSPNISLTDVSNELYGMSGLGYPFITAVLIAAAVLLKNKHPFVLTGVAIIFIGSIPFLTGRVHNEWLFIDNAFYFSSIGLFYIAAAIIEKIVKKNPEPAMRIYLSVVGISVLVVTSYATFSSVRIWKNSEVLWQKAISQNPNDLFAIKKLALYQHSKYEMPKSLSLLNTAVAIDPLDLQSRYQRGIVHLDFMNIDSAISDLKKVVEIDTLNAQAFFHIGVAYDILSQLDSAISYFSHAINKNPGHTMAYNFRGNAYAKKGKYVESFADYSEAISIDPNYSETYGNRGMIYLHVGNAQRALSDFIQQQKLTPKRFPVAAHIGLTAILAGDTILAYSNISNAIKIDSVNARLYISTISGTFFITKQEKENGERMFRFFGIR